MPKCKLAAEIERRDLSPQGRVRRKRFDESLDMLRALGLSPTDVEYYRRLARMKRRLPHELVCHVATQVAQGASLLAVLGVSAGYPA